MMPEKFSNDTKKKRKGNLRNEKHFQGEKCTMEWCARKTKKKNDKK